MVECPAVQGKSEEEESKTGFERIIEGCHLNVQMSSSQTYREFLYFILQLKELQERPKLYQ